MSRPIDYFAPPASAEEACLRGIKGSFRRWMIVDSLKNEDLEMIPAIWRAPELPEMFKSILMNTIGPHALGGEDLPDLDDGEVEVARLRFLNSVHGEVTSLRARRDPRDAVLRFRLVDEYGTEFVLPRETSAGPLLPEEVIDLFQGSEPCPVEPGLECEFSSFFYPGLNALVRPV